MPAGPLRPHDPEVLGTYRLTGRLGRGGMGTVYLGQDDTGRRVAVKVVNPELADDPAFHDRFRREVTAAGQVRRFCTAAVLDARLDGDPLYVVTEYVDGPTLDEAVAARGVLRGGDLEGLAVNIATALHAIHGAGIVHRDLKPSNVLLSPTGPRVIDFGIARAMDVVKGPTRTGQAVGTPNYMAPELMLDGALTPAADVFSWGCVIAYAGTGRAPFGGSNIPATIHRVTTGEPELEGLDPTLYDLVTWALAKDPTARPTANDLLRRLTGDQAQPVPQPPQQDGPQQNGPQQDGPRQDGPRQDGPEPAPGTGPQTVPQTSPPPVAEPTLMDAAAPAPAPAPATPLTTIDTKPPPGPGRRPPRWALPVGAAALVVILAAVLVPVLRGGDGNVSASSGDSDVPRPVKTTYDFDGPPPEPQEALFTDDFGDQGSGWPAKGSNGTRYYRNGAYLLTTRFGGEAHRDAPEVGGKPPAAQLVESMVRVDGADEDAAGGVYCLKYGRSGLIFVLRRDGRAQIATVTGGNRRIIASTRIKDLDTTVPNRLQAACAWTQEGAQPARVQAGLWVNGRPAVQATVPARGAIAGTSGILTARMDDRDGDERAEAVFDDFALHRF